MNNLDELVKKYVELNRHLRQRILDKCKHADSFEQAVELAICPCLGKLDSHQRKIGHKKMEDIRDNFIIPNEGKIITCKSFDELYKLMETADIPRFGSLTRYDVALRLGAYLELSPNKVYPHCGVKQGAKNLGIITNEPLAVDLFPNKLQKLSADEIQNFLCIYKNELKGCNSSHNHYYCTK